MRTNEVFIIFFEVFLKNIFCDSISPHIPRNWRKGAGVCVCVCVWWNLSPVFPFLSCIRLSTEISEKWRKTNIWWKRSSNFVSVLNLIFRFFWKKLKYLNIQICRFKLLIKQSVIFNYFSCHDPLKIRQGDNRPHTQNPFEKSDFLDKEL